MENKRRLLLKRLLRLMGKTCVAATLSLLLALTGILSALPFGDVFKPLTVRAASYNLSGNYTLTAAGTLQPDSGADVTFSDMDDFALDGDVVINVNGKELKCLRIHGNDKNLTIYDGTRTTGKITIGNDTLTQHAIVVKSLTIYDLVLDGGSYNQVSSGTGNAINTIDGGVTIRNIGDGGLHAESTSGTGIYCSKGDILIENAFVGVWGTTGMEAVTGNITIRNNGNVKAQGRAENASEEATGIKARAGDITISNSQVQATTDTGNTGGGSGIPKEAIWSGANINVLNSEVHAGTEAANAAAIASAGNISFSGESTFVNASNGDTTGAKSAISATSGTITISAPLGITNPASPNGVLDTSNQNVIDNTTGNMASSVTIEKTGSSGGGGGTTPTPTPTPTPSGGESSTLAEPAWKKLPSTVSDGTNKADGDTGLSVTAGSVSDLMITPLPHTDGTTAGGFLSLRIGDDFHGPAHFTLDGNVITIHPSILNTLTEGTYIIRVNYDNYTYTEARLMVLGATRPANMTKVDPPQTSDTNTRTASVAGGMLLLSFAGLFAITWKSMRRNSKIVNAAK